MTRRFSRSAISLLALVYRPQLELLDSFRANGFAEREPAYDRQSQIGKLDKALDEGTAKRWTIVDMKNDWLTIYPGAK